MLNTQEMAEALLETKKVFSVGDPLLEEIHDAGNREVLGLSEEDFTLYAHMSATYSGEPPESYRVLNAFVLDLVTENIEEFNNVLATPTIEFLKENYQDGDLSDMDDGLSDFIWESQIDFLPMLDPDNKRIYFDIELVLVMESLDTSEPTEEESLG